MRRGAVLVVEGDSDRAALEAVAVRRGRDLAAEGVRVVAVGGATNVRRFLASEAPIGVPVTVLCDQAEETLVRGAWERAGTRGVEPAVFVCVADLEEELIRAAGTATVLDVVAAQGEDRSFAALRQQPAHRDRPVEDVLRRFMGSRSGRKATYARLLVEALPLGAVPVPLDAALAATLPVSTVAEQSRHPRRSRAMTDRGPTQQPLLDGSRITVSSSRTRMTVQGKVRPAR